MALDTAGSKIHLVLQHKILLIKSMTPKTCFLVKLILTYLMAARTGNSSTVKIDLVQVKCKAGISIMVKCRAIHENRLPSRSIMTSSTIFSEHTKMFSRFRVAGDRQGRRHQRRLPPTRVVCPGRLDQLGADP